MTFDPARSVNSSFARFGVAAVLDPDGIARAVRVIPDDGDVDVRFDAAAIRTNGTTHQIRASEMAGFGAGALLEIGADRWQVKSEPEHVDPRGLVLRLDTYRVAA